MSNGKKIFISHSSKDQEYVDAFIQLLKKINKCKATFAFCLESRNNFKGGPKNESKFI
ncbi:hypothetical protein [Enterococcus faecalis]|uniref:hypothetical protein n=1 Tax=Enterococcus faecalis TaxID=1351 RepID=UPI0034CFDFA7